MVDSGSDVAGGTAGLGAGGTAGLGAGGTAGLGAGGTAGPSAGDDAGGSAGPDARRAMGRATVALPHVAPLPTDKGAIYHASAVPPAPSTGAADAPFYAGEDSGSLTGHVLSGGLADANSRSRSRTAFMILLIGGVVLILAAFGVTFATAADEVIGNVLSQIFGTG